MKPILIDTNASAGWRRGIADTQQIIDRAMGIGLSVIVLGELLSGFKLGDRIEQNLNELESFIASPSVSLLPIDGNIAERYSTLFAELRRGGKLIPTNDIWIAASALERGYDVFTFDAHFRAVPGLKVVATLADFEA